MGAEFESSTVMGRSVDFRPWVDGTVGSAVRSSSLIGRIGLVVSAVRGGARPGEIRVVVQGIAHYYLAYAVDAVPIGAEVLVINYRGARQVDVEPWSGTTAGDAAPGIAEGSK